VERFKKAQPMHIDGSLVLITGASSGIGAADDGGALLHRILYHARLFAGHGQGVQRGSGQIVNINRLPAWCHADARASGRRIAWSFEHDRRDHAIPFMLRLFFALHSLAPGRIEALLLSTGWKRSGREAQKGTAES
jgi:hypothetical protein